jgi:serine/threonine-protein kinase/endoribonuclease IRE1
MDSSISQLVDKCPYLSKQGLYISSSKESILLLLNLNTGSVNHLGTISDANIQNMCNDFICKNESAGLALPTYGKSSFWLILTQYHLDALELSLGSALWKIKYGELRDLSLLDNDWKSSSVHPTHKLLTAGPLSLQAHGENSRRGGNVKWEFTAPAPILGAYKIIEGKHLVKIKINEKLILNPKSLKLYSFQRTVFGTYDWTDDYSDQRHSFTSITEDLGYGEAIIPLRSHTALDIMRGNTLKDIENARFAKARNTTSTIKSKSHLSSALLIFAYVTTIIIVSAILLKMIPNESKKEVKVEMINKEVKSKSLNEVLVGCLTIRANKILGYGSMGTIVYKGYLANRSVAVKRLLRAFNTVATKEVTALIASDNHPHVLQYFAKEEDGEFIYIALEKCAGSFNQLIEHSTAETKSIRLSKLFTVEEIQSELLIQLFKESLEGLEFLHANKIVHRDLKPQNILISKRKKAKISDMGLCKELTNIERSFETNATGTWGWQPAEVLSKKKQNSSIDIFSMGCILYYSLSGGRHPFGDKFSRESNILQGKYDLSDLKKKNCLAAHLIEHMIPLDPTKRPTVSICLTHILFWDYEKRLNFLCDISNKLEYDYGVNQSKGNLVQGFEHIAQKFGIFSHCEGKWNTLIDKFIITELINHRKKYNYSSSTDLIRVY